MPRTKPAEERRADLLAAGQALFVEKGIGASSLEDITSRAGVSKGLFYLYFRSKDELVLALQEQFSNQFAERVRAAADAQEGWPAKLDACVTASFACYRERYALHEVLFRHGSHGAPAHGAQENREDRDAQGPSGGGGHEPAHALLVDAVRELLEAGVAAGDFDVEDPGTTAVLFYVTMHAFDPAFHGSHPPTDDQLVRSTQYLFRRVAGVAEPPPPIPHPS